MTRYCLIIITVIGLISHANAQRSLDSMSRRPIRSLIYAPGDADSTYILRYRLQNDIRLIYGAQGTNLSYGSTNENNEIINSSLYNNVNDLMGFGLTYKFIDFDLTYSLKNVQLLEEDRQNLSQFRVAYSYTMRRLAVRGYFLDSKGVIVEGTKDKFESDADVHQMKIGAQVTYFFNFRRYSYRAANFQNELQSKSAGSFLIRVEPFYRSLGMETPMVPPDLDVAAVYGQQEGLKYVKTPGVLVMPGYGYNWAISGGKFFISPIVFFGSGLAVNIYRADDGKHTFLNREWGGSLAINMGYNGARMYATLRGLYEAGYFRLNPSYFTTNELKITLTVGVRFDHLESFIPSSLF